MPQISLVFLLCQIIPAFPIFLSSFVSLDLADQDFNGSGTLDGGVDVHVGHKTGTDEGPRDEGDDGSNSNRDNDPLGQMDEESVTDAKGKFQNANDKFRQESPHQSIEKLLGQWRHIRTARRFPTLQKPLAYRSER